MRYKLNALLKYKKLLQGVHIQYLQCDFPRFFVTGSTSEGWGRPIPGLRLRSPLETFEDCVHCGDKYHDSTMCPTTFTLERCTYCNGNRYSPTQCPSIIAQAFNYAPCVKATPIPISPKPEEGAPTSSRYPECAIKPLPQRAREPRP
jgi:hypothetical protein